jgi:ADP-ribose pyrophosphatase YjhB (NUDIX family)
MAGRVKLLVAVHLFLIKDRSVLLLRRYNTGYEDGNYSVVAGHIDGNEHVYDAMIREAKEEAGITLAIENLEIIQVMHRKAKEERIDYFFFCGKWEGEIKNMEPQKCDELAWYPLEDLPENTIEYINAAIENYRKGIKFSLFGW